MKVIGAGLARTATTTQMFALEKLGFGPCYHMRNVLMDLPGQLPYWEAVAEGNPDWDAIFGDAQSTVDWPSARYYKELMEVYPDAKVLLSVREPDAWVRSMRETVWGIYYGESVLHHVSDARTVIDEWWRRYTKLMAYMSWDENDGALRGDTHDDEEFGRIMERWNEEVKRTVPADRLLVWNPKEGWDPLCDFLGVEIPPEPLPRMNDTASFKEGVIGGSLQILNDWWDKRERPATGLHGAPLAPS